MRIDKKSIRYLEFVFIRSGISLNIESIMKLCLASFVAPRWMMYSSRRSKHFLEFLLRQIVIGDSPIEY